MARIRVLVAEDSLTVRKRLVEILSSDPELEVVGEAADGKQAIDLCQALRPDIMTLDMMMPILTGVAVTEHVMGFCPTPILIVSASLNRGELFKTFDALAAGALDVLDKPLGDDLDARWEKRFLSAVKLVSRIKVVTHLRARLSRVPSQSPARTVQEADAPRGEPFRGAPGPRRERRLVAVGASTGGPAAIADLLRGLPVDFPLPLLVVLHMGKPFEVALGEWLDAQSRLRVTYAVDGAPLPVDARVVMAPADRHMVVAGGRLHLTDGPERHSCKPSVDELFESVARELGPQAIGCLLTGMGRDGAKGLLDMKRAGATTLAQDEASSVVFGMPREAILLGAADHVLPLVQFAPTLATLATTGETGMHK